MAASERIAAVRSFNRFYTRRIGVLGPGLLGTEHPLPRARVLFELGQGEIVDVAELRRALDIDPGHLSRLLAGLEGDGLVSRGRSAVDGRRQTVALTAAGKRAFAELDARAVVEIGGLLEPLGEAGQRRVLDAMRAIEEALAEQERPCTVALRAPRAGEYGWMVARHGALYAQEYGWDGAFEAFVARIVADYLAGHDPEREAAWIAEVDGEPAGCVLCVRRSDDVAQLRILLVEPSARGLGVGGRLVDECIAFSSRAGYSSIMLWTNEVLHAARRIYERRGFQLLHESPHHSFGADLVEQTWSLALE